MYAVTVTFDIEPGHEDDFRAAVTRQAENSVNNEPDCERFDFSVDPNDPSRFFLYEIYKDEAAFQTHLASDHYANFSATTEPWVKAKVGARFLNVRRVSSENQEK